MILTFNFIFIVAVLRRILVTHKSPWFAYWIFILRFKYLSFKVKLSWLKFFLSENLQNIDRRVLRSHQSILESNNCAVWNVVGFINLFSEATEVFLGVVLELSINIVRQAFHELLIHLNDYYTTALEKLLMSEWLDSETYAHSALILYWKGLVLLDFSLAHVCYITYQSIRGRTLIRCKLVILLFNFIRQALIIHDILNRVMSLVVNVWVFNVAHFSRDSHFFFTLNNFKDGILH